MLRVLTAVTVAALLSSSTVLAQGQVLVEKNVSLQLALTMAQAAIARCKADGYDVTAAVVDRAGDLKLLLRADSANPPNADLARRKAYTARTYGLPSLQWAKNTAGASDTAGQRQLVDVIALGGGLPILVGTDKIGGLGVSGAPVQEADEKCATAGLAAVASALK